MTEKDPLAIELYAWIGEDELGSGEVGIKLAYLPTGITALVGTTRPKMDNAHLERTLTAQAHLFQKTISLVRFTAVEIVKSLPGEEADA